MKPPTGATYSKGERLRKRAEFLAVQRGGTKLSSEHFLAFVQSGPKPLESRSRMLRVGFTVSKKVGGAVERNRLKRIFREAYRRHKAGFSTSASPLDVVFVAKNKAAGVSFATLEREFVKFSSRHFSSSQSPFPKVPGATRSEKSPRPSEPR